MPPILRRWLRLAFASGVASVLIATPALGEEGRQGRLVDAAWLQFRRADVLILDASMTRQHAEAHIPGAVSADLYRFGPAEPARAAMEQRIQSWGIDPGRKVVIYDQGGDMMATRLFYDLYYYGVPADDLFILDGGLTTWRAQGGAVTKDATPPPAKGTYRVEGVREEVRTRLPEFLAASGDRANHALIEALEPTYHYGIQKFFDRGGHVPNAIPMPSTDFYNADKTFKSPDEIRRLARYVGLGPEQVVHSHCGGGVAASVPWFALKFMVGHPQVKMYVESQREWLRDDRGLPYWTFGAPYLLRDGAWLDGWNAPMLRAFGVAQINIVDVRRTDQYALGHVRYALNIPAEVLRGHLDRPDALSDRLGASGVNPAHEVVVVGERGLSPDAALAFLFFEQIAHRKVSVLMDSPDDWGMRGFELTREPTAIGVPGASGSIAVPAATYGARKRAGVVIADPKATRGEYPKVFVASGRAAAARAPEGPLVRLPYTDLLTGDGKPKSAQELWTLIAKAGVPRQAEVILFADDTAEAAVSYFIFRLMGWPDVKVWAI